MQDLRIMWFVPPPIAALARNIAEEVEGVLSRSSDEQFEALAKGECHAVITAMDNVFDWNRRAGSGDFQIIAQMERTTPLSLIGHKNQTLSELKGAEFLVDALSNGFVVALHAMLASAGVAAESYSVREAGGVRARFEELLAGNGDATLLGPPFDGMAIDAGLSRIARVQDVYPQFPGQGLVTRQTISDKHHLRLSAWLQALDAACRQARTHSDIAGATTRATGAAAMVSPLPVTLQPDRQGIELLINHRRLLGMPGGDDTYESLVSNDLLARIKEENQ